VYTEVEYFLKDVTCAFQSPPRIVHMTLRGAPIRLMQTSEEEAETPFMSVIDLWVL